MFQNVYEQPVTKYEYFCLCLYSPRSYKLGLAAWLCYSINMSYKFNKNQKLLIQLINGDVIEGQFVSSTSSRLNVRNCLTPHTQTKDPSTQHFYESEIVNVKAFELEDVQSDTSEEQLKVEVEANKVIKIPQNKYNALKALNKSYVYMATMDARYYTAVDDLVNCETIACTILSTDFGRAAPIELLVLATWEQVYIFDISLYNCKQFPDALKYILECEDIVKVVHDSRGLVDCMHHQYHIKVMNIFDTYVATEMVSDEKLTLPECLLYYFNFPLTLIKEAMVGINFTY